MRMTSLRQALLILSPIALLATATEVSAQPYTLNDICADWPGGPQPRPKFSTLDPDSTPDVTKFTTGLFPKSVKVDPTPVPGFDPNTEGGALYPPGNSLGPNPTNLLPTVYANAHSCSGAEIINSLPSTADRPYNLHVEDPLATPPTPINATSPTDDLDTIRRHLNKLASKRKGKSRRNPRIDMDLIQMGIDILEGNEVPDRAYSGIALLHYTGPLNTGVVDPETRTVKIHVLMYDSHLEADTMYIDPSLVEKLPDGTWDDRPWFIEYTVDALNRGEEDFSPFAIFFDDPKEVGGNFVPNVAMDQTFFPMEEGLRYKFTMKMPPARFYNLTYHWGWRRHPPRVQAIENVLRGFTLPDGTKVPRNYFEKQVFGDNPRANEQAKLDAISMIGDLAPAKRMWSVLRAIRDNQSDRRWKRRALKQLAAEFDSAFFDWGNRNELPSGFVDDPDADVTLVYLNNTIYGHVKGWVNTAQPKIDAFSKRGDKVKFTLKNGDYFVHQYTNVDFGGMRGMENTFHNTLPVAGAGPWFTFGRINWWVHTAGIPTIALPPATRPAAGETSYGMDDFKRMDRGEKMLPAAGRKHRKSNIVGNDLPDALVAANQDAEGITVHRVETTFTFDPSQRLRIYQFDAFHHGVAVWSMH